MTTPTEQQPAAQPPYQPQQQKKGLAVAALVLGILAILGCLIPLLNVFSILLALVGLVLGVVAVRKAKKSPMTHGGRGQGIAGIVLSVLAILGAVLVNALFGAAVNSAAEDPEVQAAIQELEASVPEEAAPVEEAPVEEAPVEEAAAPVAQETPAGEAAAGLGQPVRDGDFEFVVNGIDCGETTIGDEFLSTDAQGQFCQVALSITNIGDSAGMFFGDNTYLINDAGQEFSADSEAAIYLGDNADGLLSEINPGNTLDGTVVFDVPADATPVAIELHDSAFSDGVQVALQ